MEDTEIGKETYTKYDPETKEPVGEAVRDVGFNHNDIAKITNYDAHTIANNMKPLREIGLFEIVKEGGKGRAWVYKKKKNGEMHSDAFNVSDMLFTEKEVQEAVDSIMHSISECPHEKIEKI
ncbi:MAG: hypothetical protein ACETVN_04060, partial [Asgard group archaeon]